MTMKLTTYEEKIVNMRKKDNSYLITILNEALKWNNNLDEILVLCDILRILDKYQLGVSKNEVRNTFNKFYKKECHGDKRLYLSKIYKNYGIKNKIATFTPQVRKTKKSNHQKDEVGEKTSHTGNERIQILNLGRLLPSDVADINKSSKNTIPLSNNAQKNKGNST